MVPTVLVLLYFPRYLVSLQWAGLYDKTETVSFYYAMILNLEQSISWKNESYDAISTVVSFFSICNWSDYSDYLVENTDYWKSELNYLRGEEAVWIIAYR